MPDIRVRYKDAPDKALIVRLIRTWHRGEIDHAVMSASSGPKDYVKNIVFAIFEARPSLDAVSMVRASGSPFFIARQGRTYFDMSGREVEVQQRITRSKENQTAA